MMIYARISNIVIVARSALYNITGKNLVIIILVVVNFPIS
jgi:hypothetical protein